MFINKSLAKNNNILFILLLVITTTFVRLGNEFYLLFYTEIIQYFKIEENEVNNLIRFNFAGYVIASIVAGPIIDACNKKKVFIMGVLLYILSSTFCYFSESFNVLLFGRFIQGLSESTLYIISWVILFDHFSITQSAKMSGLIRGLSKILLIIFPLLTVWLSKVYNWHLSFIILPVLSIISFVVAIYAIKDNVPDIKNKLKIKAVFSSYLKLLKSFEFVTYVFIYAITSSAYIVFFSNASIVFVNTNLTLEKFSYFRSAFSGLYILFSFISVYIINKKGVDYTKNIGFVIFLIGSSGVLVASILDKENINMIFMFILVVAIGSALMIGFLLKAINIYPDMKGAAMSTSTIITGMLSAREIFWSQVFLDSTIIPSAVIIFSGSVIAIVLLSVLYYRKSKI